jgi:ATP-dependent helicase/nuclease subunit A
LLVYFYEQASIENIVELKVYTKKEVLDFCEKVEDNDVNVLEIIENEERNEQEIEKIGDLLNQIYKYDLSTKIPTKTSVTKIKHEGQEQIEISFPSPKFTQKEENIKLTGAQKGTLLHLCMQKLDEKQEYDLEKVKQLITNLVKKEIITDKQAENINPMSILKFTQSRIWQEMKQAKEVQKEKPFYITIPAEEIYKENVPEKILVQGIIDLYYINKEDELILVDYKTDFVQKEEELVNKYKEQLKLYKKALEEALNKNVKSMFIYSTFLGKEIEVLK